MSVLALLSEFELFDALETALDHDFDLKVYLISLTICEWALI